MKNILVVVVVSAVVEYNLPPDFCSVSFLKKNVALEKKAIKYMYTLHIN